ncbi:MAG: GH1 family beta-glucosidase [Opitutus sp.]
MAFPKDFVWGTATSAYQIEGAVEADGRGPSVWDAMCSQPGKIHGGDSGAVACDHYHRSAADVQTMGELGVQAYRFSIAWPRVIPAGVGAVNSAGLAFYDRLVDELLAAKIEPWVTLFHWDFPLALYQRGGWLNVDSPQWFADYTRVVVDRLSDRVKHWITLNEPQCFVGLGHQTGVHAPGDQLPLDQVLLVAHRVLLAHGKAVQVIRAGAKQPPLVGWAPTGDIPIPASDSPADIEAAREAHWAVASPGVWNQSWWMNPVLHGRYPEDGLKIHGSAVPAHTDAEMETIRQPLDFLGLNIYNGYYCSRGAAGTIDRQPFAPGFPQTHNNWNVTPEALRWGATFGHERSGLPVVITENGMAGHDWITLDGAVHDAHRIDYLQRYLRELKRAIDAGVPVKGYFAWSLMDNFEWAEGYRYRFGLIHVDYATQQRTLKDSAYWYREMVQSNGEDL